MSDPSNTQTKWAKRRDRGYGSTARLSTQIDHIVGVLQTLCVDPDDKVAQAAVKAAHRHIATAIEARNRGSSQSGWFHLHAAEREMLRVLDEEALLCRIRALGTEAEASISGWRKDAILDILSDEVLKSAQTAAKPDNSGSTPSIDISYIQNLAIEAFRIRDQYFDDRYRDQTVIRRQLNWLLMPLSIGILVTLVSTYYVFFTYDGPDPTNPLMTELEEIKAAHLFHWFLLASFGIALTAASISAVTGIVNLRKVPNQFDSQWVTTMRVCVGGASGIFAFYIADAGIITFIEKPSVVLMLAFALGFSEKLLVGVMGKFSDRIAKSAASPKS